MDVYRVYVFEYIVSSNGKRYLDRRQLDHLHWCASGRSCLNVIVGDIFYMGLATYTLEYGQS